MITKRIFHIKGRSVFQVFLGILSFFFLYNHTIYSQIEIEDEGALPDSVIQAQQQLLIEQDSLAISVFYLEDIHKRAVFKDSFLHYHFLQYNPVFEQETPHLFLGNNGSAATPYTQILERKTGFDLGFHAYDIYKMTIDSFRWHETNIPFSDLYFSAGPTENEFRVKAKFTTNFQNNINFNIDYERIVESGYYAKQATKQSSLSAGFWQRSKDNKRNTFITYITNIHQENNNGGIADTSLLDESNYSIRVNLPVRLSGALGRLETRELSFLNHYHLNFKPDSLLTEKNTRIELISKAAYEYGFFKYYDEITENETDSLYYGPLLVDDLGLRHYISYNRIGVDQALHTYIREHTGIKAGIAYNWWMVNRETEDLMHKHELFVYGKLASNPFNGLDLTAQLKYHLGSYIGDFELKLVGAYRWNDYVDLSLGQNISSGNPSLIEESFYINSRLIQENNFENILVSETNMKLSIPGTGSSVGFALNNITNHIYFDSTQLFTQIEGITSINTFFVSQHIRYRGFNLFLGGHLFLHNSDVLKMPDYNLNSRIYYKGPFLGNRLYLNAGLEFIYMDGFSVPGYQAIIGQFYPQDDFKTDSYPMLNAFLGFKIQGFRFFVRSENILNAISGKVHYQSYLNPLNDFRPFRLGILWQLTN